MKKYRNLDDLGHGNDFLDTSKSQSMKQITEKLTSLKFKASGEGG